MKQTEKVEKFYHDKGFVCFALREADKEVLRDRGWMTTPFEGVHYRSSFSWSRPCFGDWVYRIPHSVKLTPKEDLTRKPEPKEYVEDRSELVPEAPKKKRGRRRKED
jgi:hypothetical protein